MCVAVSVTRSANFIRLLVWDPPLLPRREEAYFRQGKPFLLLEGCGGTELAPVREGSCDSSQLAFISAVSGQAVHQALCPLLIISERNATE